MPKGSLVSWRACWPKPRALPTFRARWIRFLLKHYLRRKYVKAGKSVPELRALDEVILRNQKLPKGTEVSPVKSGGLSGDWIQGPGANSDTAILYLHGGAFVTGSPAVHRELPARVSSSSGIRVFSLTYRLAPEYPFPAALEDTLEAYRWLLDQGYAPSSLVLGGESSGGGLALQALLSMKKEAIPLPKAAFFFSPVTDWAELDGESYSTRARLDPLISRPQCEFTASLYVGDNPRDTPLFRPAEMDLTGLPPMWIQVGDHEILLSDAERLAGQASGSGVEVDFKVWPGLWHVFQGAARFVPEAQDSIAELGSFIRKQLGKGGKLSSGGQPGNPAFPRGLASLCFSLLGVIGCDSASSRPVVVTDSAGIRVTLNADASRTYAEVNLEPVLSFGGAEADGPTQFFRIQDVHFDQLGRLWVADGQSAELRIFLPDGSHWKTLGGRGDGPGEFRRIHLLGSFRGDSIAVWDDALARLTVYEAEGDWFRTQLLPTGDGPPIRARGLFPDGSLLGQIPRIIQSASIREGQILGDSVRLVRHDVGDSTEVFQAGAMGPRWLWTGRNQVPVPFTWNAGFDVIGETVHLAAGPEFRISVFRNGEIKAIYGIDRRPGQVTEADRDAYRTFTEEFIPEPGSADYLAALAHPDVPTEMPGYSRILAASDGGVWARIYSPDPSGPFTWDVFTESGEWMGQVVTPADFTVMDIADGQISGVWRNDLGVEHVRVFRIVLCPKATEEPRC